MPSAFWPWWFYQVLHPGIVRMHNTLHCLYRQAWHFKTSEFRRDRNAKYAIVTRRPIHGYVKWYSFYLNESITAVLLHVIPHNCSEMHFDNRDKFAIWMGSIGKATEPICQQTSGCWHLTFDSFLNLDMGDDTNTKFLLLRLQTTYMA